MVARPTSERTALDPDSTPIDQSLGNLVNLWNLPAVRFGKVSVAQWMERGSDVARGREFESRQGRVTDRGPTQLSRLAILCRSVGRAHTSLLPGTFSRIK